MTGTAVQALINAITFSSTSASASGTRSINFAVTENGGTTSNATESVSVAAAGGGNLPTIGQSANIAINESATPGQQTVSLANISANGTANQTLSVTATSDNQSLVANGSITVNYITNAATGNIVFTPVANVSGTANITVTVTDSAGSATDKFELISVAPPTITPPANQSASENSNHTITFSSTAIADSFFTAGNMTVNLTDLHGNLTVQSVANGATISGNGTANVTLTGTPAAIDLALAANVIYHGNAGFTGSDTLTITANDKGNTPSGIALSSNAVVNIAVSAPTISTNVGFATPIGAPRRWPIRISMRLIRITLPAS